MITHQNNRIPYPQSLESVPLVKTCLRLDRPEDLFGFFVAHRAEECQSISIKMDPNNKSCHVSIEGFPDCDLLDVFEGLTPGSEDPLIALASASHAQVHYHGRGLLITYAYGVRTSVEMIDLIPGRIDAHLVFHEAV